MATYDETAALIDASADPRLDAVREVLDELLGAAESVEVDRVRRARAEDADAVSAFFAGAG